MTIKVLIVDDQQLVRSGFRLLLEETDGITIAGEASTGVEAVAAAETLKPDVVMMDIRMPDMDGIEATKRIVQRHPDSRILALTTFDDEPTVRDMLAAGASGFLLKDTEPAKLIDAIHVLHRGDALLSPSITRLLLTDVSAAGSDTDRLRDLTDREIEVLCEVGRGLSNAEIAVALSMSPLTAKTHVSRLLKKLHLRDRVQLAITAYETGLIRPGAS